MPFEQSVLPMFLVLGTVLGALAAVGAFVISYQEYRQRMLRPDQDPRRIGSNRPRGRSRGRSPA